MNRIGIAVKPNDEQALQLAGELRAWLKSRGCLVIFEAQSLGGLPADAYAPIEDMADQVGLMIVLGGDGSLLSAGRNFIGKSTPILGINLGRLGFLTDTPIGNMFDTVQDILDGNLKTRRHFSLQADAWRGNQHLGTGHAMNDVILQRATQPRMIELEMYARDQFMFRMRGDGIVLATPAGSTAYALSAGGPIVHPDIDAISVVPVCPHSLSNRPIVIPASDTIELRLTESHIAAGLNLDGREHLELQQGDRVRIRKSGYITLVYQPERHYYRMLRGKLHWAGHDDSDD